MSEPRQILGGAQIVCSADENGLRYKEYLESRVYRDVSKQQLAVCLRRAGWLALLDREESQQHSKIASSQSAQATENGDWSGEAPKCRLRCPYQPGTNYTCKQPAHLFLLQSALDQD